MSIIQVTYYSTSSRDRKKGKCLPRVFIVWRDLVTPVQTGLLPFSRIRCAKWVRWFRHATGGKWHVLSQPPSQKCTSLWTKCRVLLSSAANGVFVWSGCIMMQERPFDWVPGREWYIRYIRLLLLLFRFRAAWYFPVAMIVYQIDWSRLEIFWWAKWRSYTVFKEVWKIFPIASAGTLTKSSYRTMCFPVTNPCRLVYKCRLPDLHQTRVYNTNRNTRLPNPDIWNWRFNREDAEQGMVIGWLAPARYAACAYICQLDQLKLCIKTIHCVEFINTYRPQTTIVSYIISHINRHQNL